MKIPITLILHVELEVPDDARSPDMIKWHYEENYCIDNVIEKLHEQMVDGVCNTCNKGTILIGTVPIDDIKSIAIRNTGDVA